MKRHIQHIYNSNRAAKSAEDIFFAVEMEKGSNSHKSSNSLGKEYQDELTPSTYEKRCFEDLANAIVVQAVKDYEEVYFKESTGNSKNNISISRMKADCTKFFKSTWFSTLTSLDPVYLVENIKKKMDNLEKTVDTLIFTDEGNKILKKHLLEKEEKKDTREKGIYKYYISVFLIPNNSMISIAFPAKMSETDPVKIFDALTRKINQDYNTNPDKMFDILYPGSIPIFNKCFRITKEDYEKIATKSQSEVRGLINNRIVGYFIPNTYKF